MPKTEEALEIRITHTPAGTVVFQVLEEDGETVRYGWEMPVADAEWMGHTLLQAARKATRVLTERLAGE